MNRISINSLRVAFIVALTIYYLFEGYSVLQGINDRTQARLESIGIVHVSE